MGSIKYFEANDFILDDVIRLKGKKKIFVIFSTFGEREAELIYNKISLLRSETANLIDKIFLSHRRENGIIEELTEQNALKADPEACVLISNSINVPDMGDEKGKGADMRRALYTINKSFKDDSDDEDIVIIFLDSDVLSEYFGTHFVLGLAGPVLDGYDFAKASFWREMGRVKKFVAQPLYSLIDHPDIKKLADFAYPLSGEVAGTLKFFNSVSFWQRYGVETGINIDACFGNYRIADVNLGLYDHEHHDDINIQKMSFGIMRTFLLQLIKYNIIELKDNSRIGDIFKTSFIDKDSKRMSIEFDLSERKYSPIIEI